MDKHNASAACLKNTCVPLLTHDKRIGYRCCSSFNCQKSSSTGKTPWQLVLETGWLTKLRSYNYVGHKTVEQVPSRPIGQDGRVNALFDRSPRSSSFPRESSKGSLWQGRWNQCSTWPIRRNVRQRLMTRDENLKANLIRLGSFTREDSLTGSRPLLKSVSQHWTTHRKW